jgi:hypothetical protein
MQKWLIRFLTTVICQLDIPTLVNLILSKTVAEKTVGNYLKNTLTTHGEKDPEQGIISGGLLQKWEKAI